MLETLGKLEEANHAWRGQCNASGFNSADQGGGGNGYQDLNTNRIWIIRSLAEKAKRSLDAATVVAREEGIALPSEKAQKRGNIRIAYLANLLTSARFQGDPTIGATVTDNGGIEIFGSYWGTYGRYTIRIDQNGDYLGLSETQWIPR